MSKLVAHVKKYFIFHPIGLGIYYVIDLYAPQAGFVTLFGFFFSVIVLAAFVFILELGIAWFCKDSVKAGLIASLFTLFICFYTKLLPLLTKISPVLERYRYAVPLMTALVTIGVVLILKMRFDLRGVQRYLNILTILLILFGCFSVVKNMFRNTSSEEQLLSNITHGSSKQRNDQTKETFSAPDIYYIIADGYTSSESLKKYWNYDNTSFCGELKKRGFYIATGSLSFARYTTYSMASTFNMTADNRILSQDWNFPLKLIKNNSLMRILHEESYAIFNLSAFDLQYAPHLFRNKYLSEGSLSIIGQLLTDVLIYHLADEIIRQYSERTYIKVIRKIVEIAASNTNSPKFIYAHIPPPHFPYFLDTTATEIPWIRQTNPTDRNAYFNQIIAVNKLLLAVVDSILTNSHFPPVIIIQGDHGYRLLEGSEKYNETFTIFNAYYFPDKNYLGISPSISPYNTFRVILNKYFGTKFPLLPDTLSGIRYHGSR
jgi:hypothetical protein